MGSFCRRSFASASIRFCPSGSFFPCADVLSSCGDFFGSHAPRSFPFSLPPFRRAGGGGGGVSGCPCVASRGSSSPPARLCPAGGLEEPLVARSVHACSLLSPRLIRGLGVQELLSCGELLLPALSRLALPPHLCTPCEVMRRESLPRPAPVRVPPRLPSLRLGKPGRSFVPALGRMALVTGLVAPLSIHS